MRSYPSPQKISRWFGWIRDCNGLNPRHSLEAWLVCDCAEATLMSASQDVSDDVLKIVVDPLPKGPITNDVHSGGDANKSRTSKEGCIYSLLSISTKCWQGRGQISIHFADIIYEWPLAFLSLLSSLPLPATLSFFIRKLITSVYAGISDILPPSFEPCGSESHITFSSHFTLS